MAVQTHSETPSAPPSGILANEATKATRADRAVEAELTYLVDEGVRPSTIMPPETGGEIVRTGTYAPIKLPVRDARPIAESLSVDREGFSLVHHDTAVTDFLDEDEIRRVYYPEMERLVAAETGAARVHIFDHTVRIEGSPDRDERGIRAPVRMIHNDYTAKSGPQRVRDLFDAEEAEALLQKRFAIVNVWRSIAGPVEALPLAFADSQSIPAKDWAPLDLVYPDRVGEIYNATFSPKHRWYYFPKMARHEAALIKGYDSATDGRARFTLHTAFDDPTTPDDAAPRQSIEIRSFAFFDE